MRYQLEGPSRPKNVSVDTLVGELTRIKDRDGGIKPEAIVTDARPDDAPLHPEFEWDDPTAAEKYRIEQARNLVRAVVLVPEPEKGETNLNTVRAYVSVFDPAPGNQLARVYRPTMDVLSSTPDAEALKNRLRRELLNMRQRYMDLLTLEEALGVHLAAAIDTLGPTS